MPYSCILTHMSGLVYSLKFARHCLFLSHLPLLKTVVVVVWGYLTVCVLEDCIQTRNSILSINVSEDLG